MPVSQLLGWWSRIQCKDNQIQRALTFYFIITSNSMLYPEGMVSAENRIEKRWVLFVSLSDHLNYFSFTFLAVV